MGNLLKVLACTELEHGPIVFLDFERETIRFFFFIYFQLPLFSLLHLLCPPHPPSIPSVLANHFPSFHLYLSLSPLGSSAGLGLQGLAFGFLLKELILPRHTWLGRGRTGSLL